MKLNEITEKQCIENALEDILNDEEYLRSHIGQEYYRILMDMYMQTPWRE